MEKVYISGKITGIEDKAVALFLEAESELKEKGFKTVNPITLNHEHDKSWQSYMKEDIKALCDCTAIYVMRNAEDSKGAILEYLIAKKLGLTILLAEEIKTKALT